jgi:hypothetical protein
MKQLICVIAGGLFLWLAFGPVAAGPGEKGEGPKLEKAGDQKRKQDRQKEAAKIYLQALDAYSTSGDGKSRERLLKRLSKRGRKWSKRSAAKFARRHRAWTQVTELMKKANKMPRRKRELQNLNADIYDLEHQANRLRELAVKLNDKELQAWALQLEGRTLATAGMPADEIKKYREGAEICGQGACHPKRWVLLKMAARLLEKGDDIKEAYRLQVTVNAEKNAGLPKVKSRYIRSKAMNRLCRRLQDEKHSSDCLNIEIATVGYSTHTNFSDGSTFEKFPKAHVQKVHDDYLPLMIRCLRRAIDSGEAERGEIYNVGWTVRNDGRAGKFKSRPSVDGLEMGVCFKKVLKIFRYPRFKGERHNISLPLRVSF